MRAAAVIGVGWLASVAAAFLAGRETASTAGGGELEAPVAGGAGDAREPGTQLGATRPVGSESTPVLQAAQGAGRTPAARHASGTGLKRPEIAIVTPDTPVDIEGAKTADELVARFFAFAAAHLAGGPEQHKALYKRLVGLLGKEGPLRAMFPDEEAALPYAYPMVRFVVERDAQVVDAFETLLATGVEQPAFFEGEASDDVMEMLVEGVGPLLPGAVGPERLERLRGYVKAILAQPEASQPKPLRGNRSRMERLLAWWMPPMSSAQAVARIQQGDLKGRELLSVLRRVETQDRAQLDMPALLGPLLEEGDTRTMSELGAMELQPADLAVLDPRLFEGAAKGRVSDWQMARWLEVTKRSGWNEARGFVEGGLRRGPPTSDAVALMLRQLRPPPSATEVEQLLRSFRVSERVAGSVRAQFGLK